MKWLKIILPIFVLMVYSFTLSPTVGLIDSGELITGCYFLNILHPTGYPLYTLLGNLFSRIPIGTVAQRINFVSSLFVAVACFFFFCLLFCLTDSPYAAVVSTLLFAFSGTVWSVAVGAEVYGLSLLFLTIIVYLWQKLNKNNILFLLAFILGLSFTNHMMITSVAVATIIFLVLNFNKEVFRLRCLILFVSFFLFGLSVYCYLVIRARQIPLFNWGNPYNLERFIWHITGKQYRVWMFQAKWSELVANLKSGVNLLFRESGFGGFILLALWGLQIIFRKNRYLAIGLLIIFFLTFIYAVNYSIPDIQSYYLPSLFVLFLCGGIGLGALMEKIKIPKSVYLILICLPLLFNYRRAGMQGNYLAYDSAVNHLKVMPQNAIVITNWWDFYSPTLYLQYVEKFRPDVCVIDKELLRRSWYFQYLTKQYPWLVENSAKEIDYFLGFLDQFEHGRLEDNLGIQNAFINMINSFVDRNPARRVFFTFNDRTDYDAKSIKTELPRIPYGLLYELRQISDTIVEDIDYGQFLIRMPNLILDERAKMVWQRYEILGLERVFFLQKMNRTEAARRTLEWVLKVNPNSSTAKNLARLLNGERR